ncbi:MAG: non-heme iron oxygenase ferredoxin subunit [Chloroflexi bacterium]|nr:non-heme iron oxygenase ferredoxin subunit [Chloroflexota bacterium]
MARQQKVASLGDVGQGEMKLVEVGEERVLLANVEGKLYAVSDVCTHAACSLSEGFLEGDEVECPCHGSRFKVTSGEATQGPADEPLKRYPVAVQGRDVLLSLE